MDGGGSSKGKDKIALVALGLHSRPENVLTVFEIVVRCRHGLKVVLEMYRHLNLMSRKRVSQQACSVVGFLHDHQQLRVGCVGCRRAYQGGEKLGPSNRRDGGPIEQDVCCVWQREHLGDVAVVDE